MTEGIGMDAVTITDGPTTLEALLAVARGAPVELGPGALARITASRAVVDEVLTTGRAVYGLTTGVGHTRDDRVPDEELRRLQRALIETHASGYGPPLPAVEVRAAMMARLAGLARGGTVGAARHRRMSGGPPQSRGGAPPRAGSIGS